MDRPVDAPFKPAPLDARDLEVPVTPGMRCMPPEEMRKVHEQHLAWHRRFDLSSPDAVRRMRRYAIGCAIGVLALGALSYHGLSLWWLQVPLGALYGAWFARTQPPPLLAGLAFMGIFLLVSLAGGWWVGLGSIWIAWGWFLAGFLGGVTQQSKREEGIR